MKTLKPVLLLIVVTFIYSTVAHADVVAKVIEPASSLPAPTWIVDAVKFLEKAPYIGHVIVLMLAIIAAVSAVLTPLTALLMALEKVFGWVQLDPVCVFLNQKAIPFFARFSNFNVQNTPPAPELATPSAASPEIKV